MVVYLSDFRALEAIVGCRVGTRPARGTEWTRLPCWLAWTVLGLLLRLLTHFGSCGLQYQAANQDMPMAVMVTGLSGGSPTSQLSLRPTPWERTHTWYLKLGQKRMAEENVTKGKNTLLCFSLKEHVVRQLSEYFCLDEETSAALSLAKLLFTDGYRQCRDESGQSTESKWLMSS